MRPVLNKGISINDFENYYWLKKELQEFCRENGMSTSGSKAELQERIRLYITTGEVQKPIRKRVNTEKVITNTEPLSLETVITADHRCSQDVRAFFKTVIPKFHFSTYIQNYFRNNIGKTYKDAVQAWLDEEERKKQPGYKKEIGKQFEYNQFIKDFYADPANKGMSQKSAIAAWNEMKMKPGGNKYIPIKPQN